jgi:uncharacterized membrane protein
MGPSTAASGCRPSRLEGRAAPRPRSTLKVVLITIFGISLLREEFSAANWLRVAVIGAGAIPLASQS